MTAAHLEDAEISFFKKAVSALILKEAYDRFYDYEKVCGRPESPLVIASADMDALLAQAKGDLTRIKALLGIPRDDPNRDPPLYRVNIPNTLDHEPFLLTKDHPAANENFLEGNYTADGVYLGSKIPAGYWEIVIKQLGEKVLKTLDDPKIVYPGEN